MRRLQQEEGQVLGPKEITKIDQSQILEVRELVGRYLRTRNPSVLKLVRLRKGKTISGPKALTLILLKEYREFCRLHPTTNITKRLKDEELISPELKNRRRLSILRGGRPSTFKSGDSSFFN